jgi:hypothetical protein
MLSIKIPASIMASATLLFLCDAKAPHCRKNKALKDLGHYAEWPKVADAVIKAGDGIKQGDRVPLETLRIPQNRTTYGSKIPLRTTKAWAVANCATALMIAVTLAWVFSSAGFTLAFGASVSPGMSHTLPQYCCNSIS